MNVEATARQKLHGAAAAIAVVAHCAAGRGAGFWSLTDSHSFESVALSWAIRRPAAGAWQGHGRGRGDGEAAASSRWQTSKLQTSITTFQINTPKCCFNRKADELTQSNREIHSQTQ